VGDTPPARMAWARDVASARERAERLLSHVCSRRMSTDEYMASAQGLITNVTKVKTDDERSLFIELLKEFTIGRKSIDWDGLVLAYNRKVYANARSGNTRGHNNMIDWGKGTCSYTVACLSAFITNKK
jgi:hypothetical protein